jgi:hypothetical protein
MRRRRLHRNGPARQGPSVTLQRQRHFWHHSEALRKLNLPERMIYWTMGPCPSRKLKPAIIRDGFSRTHTLARLRPLDAHEVYENATRSLCLARLVRLSVPVPPGAAPPDPGVTASGGGLQTNRPPPPPVPNRSHLLGLALSPLDGLAGGAYLCPASHNWSNVWPTWKQKSRH